jgi:tripartite-type tricarboxylate transporter receptor subunit TctC
MMGGLFVALTGAPLKHVPYKGSAGAANDLVAGVVESSFAGVPNALAQVPQGRLKALAVTTAKRIPQLPDVPTMQEAGVAGYDASVWLALLAPAGTPREIVMRLNTEVAKLMNTPDTRKALFDAGVEASPSTPEEMAALMAQDLARWGKVVKETGVRLE